ncbi:MAG: type IV pilus modification PilV family protein [Gemmatimonadales bacterium]
MRTPAGRAGFTLIEVTIALVMLAFVVLSLQSTTGRFLHVVTQDRVRAEADAIADGRIAQVRLWPDYGTLEAQFRGTQLDQPRVGWAVTTTVLQVGGAGRPDDFKRVTVQVTAPTLSAPVQRTVSVAAP